MLIDTYKTYRRLTEEYGFTEQHAEGIIETISSAEEQVATKEDIARLEEDFARLEKQAATKEDLARLRAAMWRVAVTGIGIILAALALATTIIVSYG